MIRKEKDKAQAVAADAHDDSREGPMLRRLALGAAGGALLAGCTWVVNSAQCVLEYIVPGEIGTIGCRMAVEWGTVPVAYVEFDGYPHVLGNGTTGHLELFDEGFLVVSI